MLRFLKQMLGIGEQTLGNQSGSILGGMIARMRVEENPPSQSFAPLSDETRATMDRIKNHATKFVSELSGNNVGFPIWPRELDIAFSNWNAANDEDRLDEESVAWVLGTALGEYIKSRHDMDWKWTNDGGVPEPALCHREVEIVLYPVSSVRKRIEDQTTEFFESFCAAVEHQIQEVLMKVAEVKP